MRFKAAAITATALCLGFAAVSVAQETPQAKREQLMKQVGGAMAALGGIAKGEKPYDEAAVRSALTAVSTNLKAFPDQFPAGSEADSAAAPAIWQNTDDFRSKALALAEKADTALASFPADQAGVGAAMQSLGSSCGDCHQTYRLKR